MEKIPIKTVSAASLTIRSKVKPVQDEKKNKSGGNKGKSSYLSLANVPDSGLKNQVAAQTLGVTDKISAVYTDDYNIILAHNTILYNLQQQKDSTAKEIEIKLEKEKKIVQQPQTKISRRISLEKIGNWQKEFDDIKSGNRIKTYMEEVKGLLEKYKRIGSKIQKIDFVTQKSSHQIDSDDDSNQDTKESQENKERTDIIANFLKIAKKYIHVDLMREMKNENVCLTCGYSMISIQSQESGLEVCPRCGTERSSFCYNKETDNSGKTQTLIKTDYDDVDNFYKALMRYQGKQQNKLPNDLLDQLTSYFDKLRLPTSEKAKSFKYDQKGRKIGTDISAMFKALQELGFSQFYEDVNLICHLYWDWKLPDVSHLEELILADYSKTQRVYERLEKTRSSSLGTSYRLFKHLQLRGCDVSTSDFKICKIRESLETQDQLFKMMVEQCGDPDLYFIPTI